MMMNYCEGVFPCITCNRLGIILTLNRLASKVTRVLINLAIYGDNFCTSAHRAYTVLGRNALRVIAINTVGDFVLFLGKLGVVTAVVFIGIELLQVGRDPHISFSHSVLI